MHWVGVKYYPLDDRYVRLWLSKLLCSLSVRAQDCSAPRRVNMRDGGKRQNI